MDADRVSWTARSSGL